MSSGYDIRLGNGRMLRLRNIRMQDLKSVGSRVGRRIGSTVLGFGLKKQGYEKGRKDKGK